MIHLGTSGWQYADWKGGAFYPQGLPQREWLAFYAARFSTVFTTSSPALVRSGVGSCVTPTTE